MVEFYRFSSPQVPISNLSAIYQVPINSLSEFGAIWRRKNSSSTKSGAKLVLFFDISKHFYMLYNIKCIFLVFFLHFCLVE